MKFKYFFTLVLVFLFYLPSQNAWAQTEINQPDKCSYNITIKMVFDFKDAAANNLADSLLAEWQAGMDKVWNGDFGSRISSDNYLVNYNFILQKMAEGKTCSDYPQDHCIAVISATNNQRGNRADIAMASANSFLNSQGEWTIATTGLNAAHEAGHLMGLDDEYHYQITNGEKIWVNDNYKESGPQSIMAQTWDDVSALAEHADKIIKNAAINLPAVQMCTQNEIFLWQGLINKFYSVPIKIKENRPEPKKLSGALIKGDTDPAVYLVDQTGKLRYLANENMAAKLAGPDWSKKIIWFSDSIIYTYQFGVPVLDSQ
ncbi:MAG: hypothetical protein NT116_03675 [Candidatus Parcubacteria bacterium]|nr:hypothetical protein [Candidatus Parcubacteria bacterium]